MKITKGEHYIVRFLDENVKVEVTKVTRVGERVIVEYKHLSGFTTYKTGDEFKRAVEEADTVKIEEVNEVEI